MPLNGFGVNVVVARDIPAGHKIALHRIAADAPVRKYGQIIGFASRSIADGDHVHSHNLTVREFDREHEYSVDVEPVRPHAPQQGQYFNGYLRPDCRVGTRNYIAVISSVNCSASVAKFVAERFKHLGPEFAAVDGVISFTHKSGCCVQPGDPHELLQRTIAGVARHPNIGGYLLIGLGCETNQIRHLVEDHRLDQLPAGAVLPTIMEIQQVGGVRRTIEAGVAAVRALLPQVNAQRRSRQSAAKLVLAMNCGGSDGNSGITANPALGVASDELVLHGGTSVLAETNEIYGAEHLLTSRAVTREVGEQLMEKIRWWEQHDGNRGHI
jgi:altronate hydrolase